MSELAALSPVWSHLTEIVVARGAGCWLYDRDGRAYLDMTSGIGVTNTGHCHPAVVAAVQAQAAQLLHGQTNIVLSESLLALAAALRPHLPAPLDSLFFANSGAEAVEGAVKLARHATGRPNVIVFQGSFHGRTALTMAMTTSKTIYRVGYQPLPAGLFVAPFPHAYRYGWGEEETSEWCLHELRHLLHSQCDPRESALMIVEPVLGEGGYVVPPASFLRGLRAICDEHGILLALDEVQTGFGRTGALWAQAHSGVRPDILVMAKGMASGLPMSGLAAPRALMERWLPGSHGGTYGGNALAAAAARATLAVIVEEGLADAAAARGARLVAGLRALQPRFPWLAEVRGQGLMVGVEVAHGPRQPDGAMAQRIQQGCLRRDMLLLTCGTYGNVLRWIPPLVVSESELDMALNLFAEAVAEAA